MKKLKIYISGPYTAGTKEERDENIRRAREVGRKILELGHHPYVPHTHTAMWEEISQSSYEDYMLLHLSFLEHWADALFFLGESPGANREKARAEEIGIPIFTSIEELERFSKNL
ncbi:MAG: DUF4406 domain-containing protein [Candidatus Woesearchaeota archaeon]